MKNVLISIRPKWCEKICNGEKTIEVRKTAPKEVPFKCYIYCTSGKSPNVLLKDKNNCFGFGDYRNDGDGFDIANGKVIGEFICDKVSSYIPLGLRGFEEVRDNTLTKMCLSKAELDNYGGLKTLYGWHISELKIYNYSRELSEFTRPCEKPSCEDCPYFYVISNPISCITYCETNEKLPITRPPQSWCYVEEKK